MAESANTIAESTEALFDVIVKVPSGTRLEDVEKMALGPAGIRPDRVESLIKALRSVPQAKIGAAVPRSRADAAKEQFSKAGLQVEITPVLSLSVKTEGAFDGLFPCPACKQRVTLPENRQCPNCGVFVDKMTDEALLRKKIMEQERAKLDYQASRGAQDAEKMTREQLEAQLRAEVRAELEAKLGIKKEKPGISTGIKAAAAVAVLAAVFIGGRGTSSGFSWDELKGGESAKGKASDADKMLNSVGPPSGAGGPAAMAGGAAGAAAGAGAAGAGGAGGAEGSQTGDADIDNDPLIQAAGGKRVGAKGITMEQAVAASMTLAKSVGNNTAERALAGANVGGPGAAGGAAMAGGAAATAESGGSGSAAAPGAQASGGSSGAAAGGSSAAGGASGQAAAGGAGGSSGGESAVSVQSKQLLALEFTAQLAEMGQLPRAMQIIRSLKASPKSAGNAAVASAARISDMEVKAWSMAGMDGTRARAAAEALLTEASALTDPAERALALSRVGAIVARHGQLPPEASRVFLTKAVESIKAVPDAQQRQDVTAKWAVAFGDALYAEAGIRARSGQWNKAQQANTQLETLIAQAPDSASQAKLQALNYQMKLLLGQQDKAAQAMDAALALAAGTPGLAERAAMLRSIAQLSGAATHDKLQAAATTVQTQALAKTGGERARALAQLSLMSAEAGLRGRAGELADAARATTGLTQAEAVQVNTDLIVRGDMANARVLHSVGMYAEAETVLLRLGNYLL